VRSRSTIFGSGYSSLTYLQKLPFDKSRSTARS